MCVCVCVCHAQPQEAGVGWRVSLPVREEGSDDVPHSIEPPQHLVGDKQHVNGQQVSRMADEDLRPVLCGSGQVPPCMGQEGLHVSSLSLCQLPSL